ncbi:tripartite tricarboxylate transporter substrate binding protein [Hydrogenophaga sp.]|uniref:Bug family tripartite tricarboxylate transporter substrate binding protein n=1 Tax=Hydrogenophaga sp. TaxID=1904254 RepID=UPI002717BAF6|nr:tripartite tricarboxylate transporter substrate binding protein [Hydrogenophaga sp.]MDO9433948.1 tripartite tricarboxylate transporter substrate binding protein [Hydrogenophaga sp.]
MNTRFFRFAAIATAVLTFAVNALADTYPSKPIRVITGYAPGGIGSTMARMWSEEVGKQLKQSFVVDDRPGASNSIGARAAMTAAPDGYTLLVAGINSHPLLFKGGMDLQKEMEPVAVAGVIPLAFLTSTQKNLKTVADVVAYAKANPGRLDFASSGGGAQLNLMMALFANRVGITYTHIPFKGTAEITTAIARDDVQITLLSAPSSLPLLQSGKANAVLIGADSRSSLMPDVPTPKEVGIKPFSVDSLMIVYAPKGTPKDIIQKLNAASIAVAKQPAYIDGMKSRTGEKPLPYTPEQTRAMVDQKLAELEEAARIANYKPE